MARMPLLIHSIQYVLAVSDGITGILSSLNTLLCGTDLGMSQETANSIQCFSGRCTGLLPRPDGAYAAVLSGKVDGILLTGGLAYSQYLVGLIAEMTSFIAPVCTFPGEFEMEGLAAGALRVLCREEEPQYYTGEPVFRGFAAAGYTSPERESHS